MRARILKNGSTLGLLPKAGGPTKTAQVEFSLGVEDDAVTMRVGEYVLQLTPEQAEEMSVDLRTFALEVRNGGSTG